MIWNASSNQTVWDLAIQLYGDVSFATKIVQDNNLSYTTMTTLNQQIFYEPNIVDMSIQFALQDNSKTLATGFLGSIPSFPPVLQRSFNNDFSFDFD
jgi:hypothetical protein